MEPMTIQELFELGMKRRIPKVYMPNRAPFSLIQINVGAGFTEIEGARNLDLPEWDADIDAIPYDNGTVDVIHAYHFLEHVRDPVRMLQEFQRVLAPGGVINIVVPYYTSQMAAHDLDHKHVFCEETWKNLFNNEYYNKNRINWELKISLNIIIGIVERNLCLMTQLYKEP